MIEKCAYCGLQAHPLPVYTLDNGRPPRGPRPVNRGLRNHWIKDWPEQLADADADLTGTDVEEKPPLIHVCNFRYDEKTGSFDPDWTECRDKAKADGYVFRPDLTPKR